MVRHRAQMGLTIGLGVLAICLACNSPRTSAADDTPPRKLALLVGVKEYDHAQLANLQFAENDVAELAELLRNQKFEVVLMTTELAKRNRDLIPTAANVKTELGKLLKNVSKHDLALIGLAGHGIQPLGSDKAYFCPKDANPTIREGKSKEPSAVAFPERLIGIDDLLVTLEESGVGQKLLFVDACRNDPGVRGRRGVDRVRVSALPPETGVLLSCSSGQFAFEHKSWGQGGHGAFFAAVIDGLKGQAGHEGTVTWETLAPYVRRRVPVMVREVYGKDGGDQRPNVIGNISETPAVLASVALTPIKPSGPVTVQPPSKPTSEGNSTTLTSPGDASALELINVSYDSTRELWRDLNAAFIEQYETATGKKISIKQSHGSSSSQTRAVMDGLEADVVTLLTPFETELLSRKGLIKTGWEDRLPNKSRPFSSTIVFVVRKGNPKGVKDWFHLMSKSNLQIVVPNPKTSGAGQLSFYGAWGSVTTRGGTDEQAREFLTALYQRVPVLDAGSRGSATTFFQRAIGDVYLALEHEAKLTVREAKGELELIYPPVSILAEPKVAIVDANVDRRGTRQAAEAYLRFLDSERAQQIIARNFFRPSNPDVLKKHADTFPAVRQFTVKDISKGWDDAHKTFIQEGGEFDRIFTPQRK